MQDKKLLGDADNTGARQTYWTFFGVPGPIETDKSDWDGGCD